MPTMTSCRDLCLPLLDQNRLSHEALVVAAWLLGIIVNLLTMGAYFDVALRDFGLSLGAWALWRLSVECSA